jgi:hypothetical protein
LLVLVNVEYRPIEAGSRGGRKKSADTTSAACAAKKVLGIFELLRQSSQWIDVTRKGEGSRIIHPGIYLFNKSTFLPLPQEDSMDTGTEKQGTNPGVKRGCLIWAGLFFLVAFSLGLWFLIYFPEAPPNTSPRLPPLPYRAILAFGAGLIGAIPGIIALMALDGIRT